LPLLAAIAHSPLSATVFFLMLSMASSGMTCLPCLLMKGATLTFSHTMGTFAAL
jgi:hypothetical protein